MRVTNYAFIKGLTLRRLCYILFGILFISHTVCLEKNQSKFNHDSKITGKRLPNIHWKI